jgi:hypothetical protein
VDKNGKVITSLSPVTDSEAKEFNDAAHAGKSIVDINHLTTTMKTSYFFFKNMMDGNAYGMVTTSAYRPKTYQAHLYELKTKYLELTNVNGITYDLNESGSPKLLMNMSVPAAAACSTIANKVNSEIAIHKLKKGSNKKSPAVSQPGTSYHEFGAAFDAVFNDLPSTPSTLLDDIAALAGLHRPCKEDDPVHFQLLITSKCSHPVPQSRT